MPEIVQFKNGNQIRNTYDASGRKLGMRYAIVQEGVFNPIIPGQVIENLDVSELDNVSITGTDYVGNIEYNVTRYFDWDVTYEPQEGKSLWRVYNPEGYTTHILTSMTSGPIYNYYRKDHLGNNREVWRASHLWNGNTRAAATVQRTQYYPSGLPWASNFGDNPGTQSKKYNGKEFVEMHGLDEYDSEARWFYPAIVRTTTIDPHAENYYSTSPYAWCANNPVLNIDPDGKDWYQAENGNAIWRRSSDKEYTDENGTVYKNIGTEYMYVTGNGGILFQQKTNEDGEMYLTSTKFEMESESLSNEKQGVLAMQNSNWSRDAAKTFWKNPTMTNWIKYCIKEVLSQYTNPYLVVGGASIGVSGLSSLSSSGVSTTAHGAERIAGKNATRGGVLSMPEITTTKTLGRYFRQADGATVYLHEVSPGKYNVVVEGNKGIITTMKTWSQKSIDRIGKNHGW